ncbi:hypothetical protein [Murimonas intestini]|uniref:hypothetical protein n=1 Tax=Murimonas intestini TaxID=1337051 RepID=UPI0011DD0ADE|nr:hypothetical protein [Murimonas intestini]
MPLPLILGIGAAIAGAGGVVAGAYGGAKMGEANNTLKSAEKQHQSNINRFETTNELTSGMMDELGNLELDILKNFSSFSDTIEKIQNRPKFKEYNKNGIKLPKYDREELEKASVGATVILGALSGAALGTAGGFAASGVATSAVMAFGAASTGTAISSLSGVAATNATLAALGGGALKAGGGGMALGSTILGATAVGAALFVGGIIFAKSADKLAVQADTTYAEMKNAEKTINEICLYLNSLKDTASKYIQSLKKVRALYLENFAWISFTINDVHKTDWNMFTPEEKLATQNTVLLVGLLYKMCKVNLVIKADNDAEMNKINSEDVNVSIQQAEKIVEELN